MDQPGEPGRRRRSSAETVEPTLPLDMPRAEKPAARAPAGRRGWSAPEVAETDLFGNGQTQAADARGPSGADPAVRTRRASRKTATGATPSADDATGPDFSPASAAPTGIADPGPDPGSVIAASVKPQGRKRGGRSSVQPLPDRATAILATTDGSGALEDGSKPQAEPQSHDGQTSARPDGTASLAETEHPTPDPVMVPSPATTTGATLLSPDEVLLQQVDPRSFRPNERSDSWLYWLTDRARAAEALRSGVPIEPDASVVLADRRAVLPRLAELAEDPDVSPTAIAVLRLRRITVEPFLRPGPEPACYVLAGDAKVSA